jgi:hypothetical protein
MATAGTLLSDLSDKPPVFNNDNDLVNRILADMNVPSAGNPVMGQQAPPPPAHNGQRIQSAPNPNTVYPHNLDPAGPTAHLIGKDYPTAADFANVLHPTHPAHQAPQFGHGYYPQPPLLPAASVWPDIVQQVKQPILVALIVLIVSLPAFHVLLGYYLPSLLRIGGDLTTVGLLVKAAVGGALFWFLQKIVLPLLI